ncbi:MAG TPA: ANTAR domain-containing protein [Pseudorhizobium sp.]|nr:ANTAR domain-containing protein [Pseudorhizobium sp.]
MSDKGVYAALLVARSNFDRAKSSAALIIDLQNRLSARQTIVRAVMIFVMQGKTEAEAYDLLRQTAMAWRVTIETAAERLVSNHSNERGTDDGRRIDFA